MRSAYLMTLLAVVCWATGPVGSKAALLGERAGERLTPPQVAFWGITIGWLGLLVLLAVRKRMAHLWTLTLRGWLVVGGMAAFGWIGYPVSINFAYTRLSLADAMIVSYLNPVFVVLFQGGLFGFVVRIISGWEQESLRQGRPPIARMSIGLGLCLFGVALIATGGRLSVIGSSISIPGITAALFAALAWGVYSNLPRFVVIRSGANPQGLGDVYNFGAMSIGVAIMGGWLFFSKKMQWPTGFTTQFWLSGDTTVETVVWVPIIVMAILNYCLGYTLWLLALERGAREGKAYKLPPLTYLVLAFAVTFGWMLFREPWGTGFWQGAALIALGNVVTLWPIYNPQALSARSNSSECLKEVSL